MLRMFGGRGTTYFLIYMTQLKLLGLNYITL